MKNIVFLMLFSVLLGNSNSIFSQGNYLGCGLSDKLVELYKLHPEMEEEQAQLLKNARKLRIDKNDTTIVYTVPVVFHIIHEYGTENISDAQVMDQMIVLNRDFRMNNADTSEIIADFQGIKSDAHIEFKLATKDPWGNCTNGIEHIYSHVTNQANDDSKLSGWTKSKYLNVWVVSSLEKGDASAYAYFPSDALEFYKDGIIIINDYVGRIGTGQNGWSRTLTHEIGHYLGLPHVWGDGKVEVACGDDGIDDTPETKGYTTCPANNAKICNPLIAENVQNYMDYSFCNRMFTKGQVDVMRYSLTSLPGQRSNLIKDTTSILTGIDVLSPPVCVPEPDFYCSDKTICQGANVTFTDVSWRSAVDSRIWTFEGGSPATSTSSTVNVTYSSPGYKKVSLSVQNSAGVKEVVRENYIYVSPNWADFVGPFSNNLNTGYGHWFLIENPSEDYSKFNLISTKGIDNSSCFKLANYKNTSAASPYSADWFYNKRLGYGQDALISPSFDLSNTSNVSISFKYAYATNATIAKDITETVKVYTSKNCGETWTLRKTITGAELVTGGYAGFTDFSPTTNNQWKQCTFNYTATNQDKNTRVKIEFTASDLSSNFFVDDFNVNGTLGLFQNEIDGLELIVFPNPLSIGESINVSYVAGDSPVEFTLRDVQGKVIAQEVVQKTNTIVQHQIAVDNKNTAACYFLEVKSGGFTTVRKVVVL
jgi:PKD repeat protein